MSLDNRDERASRQPRPRPYAVPPALKAFDLRARHRALRLEDPAIVFLCACGREYRKDFSRGPRHRQVTGDGLWLIFRRWQDGCSAPPCPACLRYYRRHGELPPGGPEKIPQAP